MNFRTTIKFIFTLFLAHAIQSFGFPSLGAYSSHHAHGCGVGYIFLGNVRDASTESYLQIELSGGFYPPKRNSYASFFPRQHESVLELFLERNAFEAIFPNGIHEGMPVVQVIEHIRAKRGEIAERLLELTDRWQAKWNGNGSVKKDHFVRTISDFADRFRIVDRSQSRYWSERVEWDRFSNEIIPEAIAMGGYSSDNPDHVRLVDQFGARVRTLWAELRVALIVPNVLFAGMTPESWRGSTDPNIRSNLERLRVMDGGSLKSVDFDVIFLESPRDYSHWKHDPLTVMHFVEVKAYEEPLASGSSQFKKLTSQLERQMLAIKMMGFLRSDLHLFLDTGITSAAKVKLEAEGILVHGIIHDNAVE